MDRLCTIHGEMSTIDNQVSNFMRNRPNIVIKNTTVHTCLNTYGNVHCILVITYTEGVPHKVIKHE